MGTGKTWTYNEQRVLCSKYIAVSEDPSTGNGQKSSEFWGKITLLVNEGRAPEHERTVAAVKSHFLLPCDSIHDKKLLSNTNACNQWIQTFPETLCEHGRSCLNQPLLKLACEDTLIRISSRQLLQTF